MTLIIFEILRVQTFDLKNVSQGQGVERRDLHHSIANVRIYVDVFSES